MPDTRNTTWVRCYPSPQGPACSGLGGRKEADVILVTFQAYTSMNLIRGFHNGIKNVKKLESFCFMYEQAK